MKVAVVTSSGSRLDKSEAERLGIYVVPLQVTIEGKTELEGETIGINEVYEQVALEKDVKTSLPPVGIIEELFSELKKEYDMIFAVPICLGLSGTIGTMQMVANQLEIPFDYLDCYSTFYIERYLAIKAKELFDKGMSVDEVKRILQGAADLSDTMIIPNDLNHLARGGRITNAVALLGGLLKIKPVLHLDKTTAGRIDNLDKVRTMKKAVARCIESMQEKHIDESYIIMCGHIYDEEMGKLGYDMMKEAFPNNEILFEQICSVVGVHTGVGCIGFQYIKRIDD
ncbi:MAG: DegV family protein [Erysipelotrichales bacterium]|nr:DegV family protein [Erysipelotrichales bacterium]